jgi:hypothetical protein
VNTVMNIGNRFHKMMEISRIAEKLLASQEKRCIMEIISIFCNIVNHNLGLISNLLHKVLVYLHIIHLLKSSTCFEHYPAHLQEVYAIIVYMQPLVSSLCKK